MDELCLLVLPGGVRAAGLSGAEAALAPGAGHNWPAFLPLQWEVGRPHKMATGGSPSCKWSAGRITRYFFYFISYFVFH